MSPTTPTRSAARRMPLVDVLVRCMDQRGILQHAENVAVLSEVVCERMQLSFRATEVVVNAALLHDVGKLALPASLLDRPGDLSHEECELMRTHPVVGARTLEHVSALRGAALLVRHSHERYDGWGYPDGLRGREIPLGARIIAACDAWDAMRTDRSYRAARPFDEALEIMLAGAGAQWDEEIVTTLIAHLSAAHAA